jgi:hypothetical protein
MSSLVCACSVTARITAIGSWLYFSPFHGSFECILIPFLGIVATCATFSLWISFALLVFSVMNPIDLGVLPVCLSVCALVRALACFLLGA